MCKIKDFIQCTTNYKKYKNVIQCGMTVHNCTAIYIVASNEEKNILNSYLCTFEDARKNKIANIQKEFFDGIQAGDVDIFKCLYKSYSCDMHHVNKSLIERCLQCSTDHLLEFYVTERFESMSNLFKYFTSDMPDVQIISVIAKCHGWNADLVNDKVRSIMKTAIAKHIHLFLGQDAPHYIKEFITQEAWVMDSCFFSMRVHN